MIFGILSIFLRNFFLQNIFGGFVLILIHLLDTGHKLNFVCTFNLCLVSSRSVVRIMFGEEQSNSEIVRPRNLKICNPDCQNQIRGMPIQDLNGETRTPCKHQAFKMARLAIQSTVIFAMLSILDVSQGPCYTSGFLVLKVSHYYTFRDSCYTSKMLFNITQLSCFVLT